MKKKNLFLLTAFCSMLVAGCTPKASSQSSSSSKPSSNVSSTVTSSSGEKELTKAEGAFNYSAKSYEERTEILKELEEYTMDHFLGGIPLYDNASLVLYSSRLTIPSNTYIPNYGFGVGEGTINEPMEAESVEAFKEYYHTWTSKDPNTINSLDGNGSDVSDVTSMFQSAYYSTKLTANKKSYEWYASLAKADPVALNPNKDGMATKWFVELHHNEDEYVYDIETTEPSLVGFRGRKIQLEDYLNTFKLACDNGWYRAGSDLASDSSGFVGVGTYISEVNKGELGNPDWSKVGIQLDTEKGGIVFEFNQPKTPFYAKYSLSSSMYAPIPSEFIDAIGGAENYGKSTDIDSVLSTGMYTLSHWTSGSNFALRKNDIYFDKELASFKGYHYAILKDRNVAFEEFEAGKLDSASVPSTKLEEYKEDPRLRKTLGDTVWKFQVNACTEEQWDALFGVDGSIYPHDADKYWKLKPLMSNMDFLNGLYYSVNRAEMAKTLGKNPAPAFLSDSYMADPEKGISYRSSEEGKSVLANRLPETFGYDSGVAKELFKKAVDAEVAKGTMVRGTESDPTKVELTVWYQDESQTKDEGLLMKKYWEETFNEAVDGVELVLNYTFTADYMDCYYAMMFGEFDLGFGSISGNTLDPISFMDTVCSDNRSTFTLSWGTDTSKVSEEIVYDGHYWSFDALLGAANGGAVVTNGEAATLFSFTDLVVEAGADGRFNVRLSGKVYPRSEDVQVDIVAINWYNPETGEEYSVMPEDFAINADGSWTVEVDVPLNRAGGGYLCVYYTTTVLGITSAVMENDALVMFPLE